MKGDYGEIKFIHYIQELPAKIGEGYKELTAKLMAAISFPFHFKIFIILVFLLYYNNQINSDQLFIILYSQLIITLIKFIIKRERPYKKDKSIELLEPMSMDPYSFPSGHTMNACLLSYFLYKNTKSSIYKYLPFMVGFSRVFMGVHYPSDIIGAIILSKIILHIRIYESAE